MDSDESLSLIVVGGGAAGMIAAWRAALRGINVFLLEKNSRLGIKLLISGGGKCNITHAGDVEDLRLKFRANESRFLKHAFYQFTNVQLLRQLNGLGVETYERGDGRIFPTSGKAGEVVHALRSMMERAGAEILLSSPVEEILVDSVGISGVRTTEGVLRSRRVIVATGGSSFPKTGTTGDGCRWLRQLGHTIIPLRPALAPVFLNPTPPPDWQGVAIRDCIIKGEVAGKKVASARGDILFTHLGISGPAALEVSRETFLAVEKNNRVDIVLDALPDRTVADLEKDLQAEIAANGARKLENLIEHLIPQRLAPYLLKSAGANGEIRCHQLRKDQRRAVAETLKHWSVGRVREIPLEAGEVTAGGVDLHEVDPKTMKSRIVEGLYLCGEVLDIAGPIGGYNLQAAFSTGFVAGESAAQ
jgi:predicted Rossmann fold flavoprotein